MVVRKSDFISRSVENDRLEVAKDSGIVSSATAERLPLRE